MIDYEKAVKELDKIQDESLGVTIGSIQAELGSQDMDPLHLKYYKGWLDCLHTTFTEVKKILESIRED